MRSGGQPGDTIVVVTFQRTRLPQVVAHRGNSLEVPDNSEAAVRSAMEVGADMIGTLKMRSAARQKSSEDFRKLQNRIAKYKQQKARKSVPLNEKEFMAQRADLEEEEEKLKSLDPMNKDDDVVFARDYYSNEALAITIDYTQLLETGKIAVTAN